MFSSAGCFAFILKSESNVTSNGFLSTFMAALRRMATYVNTSAEVLQQIRATTNAAGTHRRVGWYTSGDPGGYTSLNT